MNLNLIQTKTQNNKHFHRQVASPWRLQPRNVRWQAKAQLSLFIIIALVVLILVGISVYMLKYSGGIGKEQEKIADITQPPKTIKEFVDRCVYETSVSGISLLASQGGMIYVDEYNAAALEDANSERQKYGAISVSAGAFEGAEAGSEVDMSPAVSPSSNIAVSSSSKIAIPSSSKIVYGYYENINSLPSILEMEIDIEDYIDSAILFCTKNFTGPVFGAFGADMLSVGEPSSDVKIGLDKVSVIVTYPITYTDLTGQTTIDTFNAEVPLRLGYVHALADAVIEKQRLDADHVDVTFLSDLSKGLVLGSSEEAELIASDSSSGSLSKSLSESPDSAWVDDDEPVEPILVKESSPALDEAIARIPQSYTLAGRIDIAEYDDKNMILAINDTSLVFMSAMKFVKNKFPVIMMQDEYHVKEGKAFVLMVEVEDDDTDHTFTDDTSLFDITKEGMISFTSEVPGAYDVAITVKDPHDNYGMKKVKFIVDEKSSEEME